VTHFLTTFLIFVSVVELWDGEGVVRVLGRADIVELIYDAPAVDEGPSIYDFEGAVSEGFLSPSSPARVRDDRLDTVSAPNISLNVGGQRTSGLELWAIAVFGIMLQLGVVAFAGVGVFLPGWESSFKKNSKAVVSYAFPLMASGTVTLAVGMLLCAYIIDASTEEKVWKLDDRVRLAWLQKGWTSWRKELQCLSD
jgi:hypothetical protein